MLSILFKMFSEFFPSFPKVEHDLAFITSGLLILADKSECF